MLAVIDVAVARCRSHTYFASIETNVLGGVRENQGKFCPIRGTMRRFGAISRRSWPETSNFSQKREQPAAVDVPRHRHHRRPNDRRWFAFQFRSF